MNKRYRITLCIDCKVEDERLLDRAIEHAIEELGINYRFITNMDLAQDTVELTDEEVEMEGK